MFLIDYRQDFDNINRLKLWYAMESFGTPRKLHKNSMLYIESTVMIGGMMSRIFKNLAVLGKFLIVMDYHLQPNTGSCLCR